MKSKRKEAFTILAYWCPPPTDKQYSLMREAGFDTVILDDKYGQTEGSPNVKKAVLLADKYDITAYVGIRWDPWEVTTTADKANDYTGIKHFGGYYSDEPRKRIDIFHKMPSILDTMKKYPDAEYFVTLATSIDPYFECETMEETVTCPYSCRGVVVIVITMYIWTAYHDIFPCAMGLA